MLTEIGMCMALHKFICCFLSLLLDFAGFKIVKDGMREAPYSRSTILPSRTFMLPLLDDGETCHPQRSGALHSCLDEDSVMIILETLQAPIPIAHMGLK